MFDFEELENDDSMLVLCVRQEPGNEFKQDHVAYVWKGSLFDAETFHESQELSESQFVQKCIINYWGDQVSKLNIKVQEEDPENTSMAFNYFFE